MDKLYRNKWVVVSLVTPAVLTFLFAVLAPILLSIFYGFTNVNQAGVWDFVGWKNYETLFKDKVFWISLKNSLLLAAGFIVIQHPLAMIVAVTLNGLQSKAEGFFRCVYFLPNVISVAIIAYLWKFIYNPSFGLLKNILEMFGGELTADPLRSDYAIVAVLVTLIWHGFGWGMLIYYTGVKNIDPVLYEAAAIDGANNVQTFLFITLPQMRSVIQINVTLAIIAALKQMETVFMMTKGGPGNDTQFLGYYTYEVAFKSKKFGYANALGVVFIIICLLVTVFLNTIMRDRNDMEKGGKLKI